MKSKELDLKLKKFEEKLESFYGILGTCEYYVSMSNFEFHKLEDLKNQENTIPLSVLKIQLALDKDVLKSRFDCLFKSLDEYDKELSKIKKELGIRSLYDFYETGEYEALYELLNHADRTYE